MENVFNRMDPLFAGLWNSTWQASVLICLVLLLQWLVGKKLSPGWRYSLWLLVLARLALPFTPQSALSIFNLRHFDAFRPSTPAVQSYENLSTPPAVYPSEKHRSHRISIVPGAGQEAPDAALPAAQTSQGSDRSASDRQLAAWIPPTWLSGVLLLTVRICAQNVRFGKRVRDRAPVTKPELIELLEECKRTMKVRLPITMFETPCVRSPALYGLFRPRLLLPQNLVETFSRQELRHVLLHELAHVKRSDMVINWLTTVLQTLHWFNPLIWFAFSRMRADRESACDALVLTKATETDGRAYGTTIIKLLEDFARPARAPSLMGILEEKNQMRQRIRLIVHFRKPSRWSTWAVLLLVGLGLVGLTDARIPQATLTPSENASKPVRAKVVPATIRVSGTVLDEKTAGPIDSFQLFIRRWQRIPNNIGSFDEQQSVALGGSGTNGEFSLTVEGRNLIRFEVEIRAEGYVTKRSGWLELEDEVGHRVYSLAKSVPLEGLLRFADRRPATNVEVALWTDANPIMFDQTGFLNRHISLITRTDVEGKFAFKPATDALRIIALDENGYAEREVDPSLAVQRLILRPWGQVEGKLLIGERVGKGEKVGLSRTGLRMYPHTAATDDSGKFFFERVPPGEFMLSRVVDGQLFTGIIIRVSPGETVHTKLGGTGRKVVGWFTWPASSPTIDWKSKIWETRFHSKTLPPPGSLPVSLQSDGSFTVEDVPAGVYQLVVAVHEMQGIGTAPSANEHNVVAPSQSLSTNVQVASMKSGIFASGKAVAVLEKTLEVPATLQSPDNSPLEIGAVELRPLPTSLTSKK